MSNSTDGVPVPVTGWVSATMGAVSSTENDLRTVAKEVEQFVAAAGWDQPPQLFALVATTELLAMQPELADQLDPGSALTPIAQDSLPDGDLDKALAGIMWPETVQGCALVQEIVVLPPSVEADLAATDDDKMREIAAEHPDRQEARLVAAVLRNGDAACVMRLRDHDELITDPNLAPNLTAALRATFT
jgi:hypothetical protein